MTVLGAAHQRADQGEGATPAFRVLVGPDFAGKSTVLGRLRDEHGWRVVSYDERYLEDRRLISLLRRHWIADGFAWAGVRYSDEVVLSVLHTIVLYLRDELARAAGPEPVVVDSYYYKLLAKCRLYGIEHQPTFAAWRSLPRPAGALYLDLPPQLAWERSLRSRGANAFECWGPTSDRAGFISLQSALRPAVLAELGDVPVQVIDADREPDDVAATVLAAMEPAAV